jgi:hypothetical protein
MNTKKVIKYKTEDIYNYYNDMKNCLDTTDIHNNYDLYFFYKNEVDKFDAFIQFYENNFLGDENFYIELIETLH